MTETSPTPVYDATLAAIEAAPHLKGAAAEQFAGAIEGAKALARKIDAWDVIVQWAMEDLVDDEGNTRRGARPAVPQNDNVSLASYLKYMDTLGLTPAAQSAIPKKGDGAATKRGGSLASVSNIPRPTGT